MRREFLGVLGAPQRFASFEGIFASGAAVTTEEEEEEEEEEVIIRFDRFRI